MKGLKTISIVLIVIGQLLFLIGILFKISHYPDLFKGTISGPILLTVGVSLFIIYKTKKKNVTNYTKR